MATRSRPLYEATRLARWLRLDLGRELRLARRMGGLRQKDVARLLGTSTSRVCRVEHGQIATLNLEQLARHAAVVGLKPYVKLFPLGRRLLDKPQIELLGRFRARLHPAWSWATEVPIPRSGDLRSCDCVIAILECTALVEAFTAFADYQAQTASAMRKRRDLGADRLILLVAATRANRKAVAEAAAKPPAASRLRPKPSSRHLPRVAIRAPMPSCSCERLAHRNRVHRPQLPPTGTNGQVPADPFVFLVATTAPGQLPDT